MESSIYVGATDTDNENYLILKISLDVDKPGEVIVETVYKNENSRIIALEVDPEENSGLYYLDDEEKLVQLYDTLEGKCMVQNIYDLSVHRMDDVIKDFEENYRWSSILVDNRTVTIRERTCSLTTNFHWDIL